MFADMLIPILQVIWIRGDQLQGTSLLLQVELLAGCQSYRILLLCLRQVITERGVSLEKVHTKENCADMFTKPVLLEKLRWCLASLGLQKR